MKIKYTKLDNWVEKIIVDPLGKESLTKVFYEDGFFLNTNYHKKYPIFDGIYDLRLLKGDVTNDQKTWVEGQKEYEEFSNTFILDDNFDYESELKGMSKVYQEIPVTGRCLDVGGNKGTLREFLNDDQEYITCDPFLNVFQNIEYRSNYLNTYKCLNQPVNFICCNAEYLPFKSNSFDTVHMRSVIDHFLNPESALLEAYRVLNKEGSLIVGLYVYGGKKGKVSFIRKLKDMIKNILPFMGIHRYTDHHTWHPTFKELKDLITTCGFDISRVYWQTDSVCYISALKSSS